VSNKRFPIADGFAIISYWCMSRSVIRI